MGSIYNAHRDVGREQSTCKLFQQMSLLGIAPAINDD